MFSCHMTNWYHLVSSIGSIIVSHISRILIHRYLSIHPSIYLYPIYPIRSLYGPENCGPTPQAALRLVSADPCARTAPMPRSRLTGPQRPGSFTSRERGLGSFLRQWGGPRHGLISACKMKDFTIFQLLSKEVFWSIKAL